MANRNVTPWVGKDSTGAYHSITMDTAEPLRMQIADAVSDVLEHAGRIAEADAIRRSATSAPPE